MFVRLKDWLDTEVRDRDYSNIYNISEYDTSILFFMIRTTLIFLFFYIFLQFYLKFVEFVRATSVNMCYTPTHLHTVC
jgi:hypothetical protein